MKTLIIILLTFLGSIQIGKAQQLYVKTGPTISSFLYKNSLGLELENLQSASKFHFEVGNRYLLNYSTLYFTYGASWNNYGAIGSDARLDNFFEWDLTYAGLRAGIDAKFIEQRDFSVAFSGSLGAEYLVRGTQVINNQTFNIRNSDEFNPLNLMVWGGALACYELNHKSAISFQYQLGYSLFNAQSAGNDNEHLKLLAYQFSLGFLVNISNIYNPF